jgi:hypothetical protein
MSVDSEPFLESPAIETADGHQFSSLLESYNATLQELQRRLDHEIEHSSTIFSRVYANIYPELIQMSYNRGLFELDNSKLTPKIQIGKYAQSAHVAMLCRILGFGEFGKVYKGEYDVQQTGKKLDVAIKTVRENTELQYITLWQEIKIMSHIHGDGRFDAQRLNVVRLIGAITTQLRRGSRMCISSLHKNFIQENYISLLNIATWTRCNLSYKKNFKNTVTEVKMKQSKL